MQVYGDSGPSVPESIHVGPTTPMRSDADAKTYIEGDQANVAEFVGRLETVERGRLSMRRLPLLLAQTWSIVALAAMLAFSPAVSGEEVNYGELAKKLSNPVAKLVRVPIQFNHNSGFANGKGEQNYVNIQPVVPFSINDDWIVISRTILPVISQDGVSPGKGSQFGLGPVTQSFFFSPATGAGLVWGAGPAFVLPTATGGIAGSKWGAGVTGVVLRQTGPWTFGALGNRLWSVTGNDENTRISNTFLQPFVGYTTSQATSFSLNTESSYDWERRQWLVPINAVVSQIITVAGRPVQFGVGARYWADAPKGGPDGWGARVTMTLLLAR